MNESRFSVIFGGSCGFVPYSDERKVRVLLPARREGWIASDKSTIVPPHRAFMRFRLAHLFDDSPRQPDFVYVDDGGPVGICFLTNEILTLPPSLDEALFLNTGSLKSKTRPDPADSRSLEWVARLDRFCKALHVDNQYLGPEQPDSIAAALDITSGAIEADFVPPDLFDFDPAPDRGGTYQPQCLAGQVRASSRIGGTRVTIESKGKGSLELDAIDWEIRLEISNEVLDDIILPPQHRRKVYRRDFDFELLYDLTDKTDDDHCHLPVNITPGFDDSRSHQGGDCKPIIFPPTPLK